MKPQSGIVALGVKERLAEGGLFLRFGMTIVTGEDICKTQAPPQGRTGRRCKTRSWH